MDHTDDKAKLLHGVLVNVHDDVEEKYETLDAALEAFENELLSEAVVKTKPLGLASLGLALSGTMSDKLLDTLISIGEDTEVMLYKKQEMLVKAGQIAKLHVIITGRVHSKDIVEAGFFKRPSKKWGPHEVCGMLDFALQQPAQQTLVATEDTQALHLSLIHI